MAKYMTRVELHGAAHGDDSYKILHAAMEAEGFHRKILGSSGTTYHLPTAEYERSCSLTIQQVCASAKLAANKTGKTNAVLVSQYEATWWDGLTPV